MIQRYKHYLRPILVSLIFWIPLVIFLKIAGEIIEGQPLRPDTAIMDLLHQYETHAGDIFWTAVTNLGQPAVMVLLAVILSTFLFFKRHQVRSAAFVMLTVLGDSAANLVIKALFHRSRPSVFHPAVIESGFSFPSGHSMVSAALATAIIIVFLKSRFRWVIRVLAVLAVVFIGFSRLYIGVHYASDVVAGWTVSVAYVVLLDYVINRYPFRASRAAKPDAGNLQK